MSIHILIALCIIVANIPVLHAQDNISSPAAGHLRKAEELYRAGRVTGAIAQIQAALEIDESNAYAYHLLAKSYIRLDNPNERSRAEKAAEKSIELEPENTEYQVFLAKVYKDQGFTENAQKYLEKFVEEHPDDKEALYMLGQIYQNTMDRLRDLVSAEQKQLMAYVFNQMRFGTLGDALEPWEKRYEEYPVIYYEKFYDEEVVKAEEAYSRLSQLDPDYEDANRQMAILAYQTKNWWKMVTIARNMVEKDSTDRNAYLLLGLAYQRASVYEYADRAFQQFKDRLLSYERRLFDNFDLFLAKAEQAAFSHMIGIDREIERNKFWKSRDPLYLTEYNERKLEHITRVAEANLLYSAPKFNIEGWKSDRGLIWVRYGAPKRIARNLNILANRGSIRERLSNMRNYDTTEDMYEFWYYDDFSFMFYEFPLWSGAVRFYDGSEISFSEVARTIQKNLPDLYELEVPGKKFEIPYYAVDFRGRSPKTRVELFYAIPCASLSYVPAGNQYTAFVEQGVFLFDTEWNDVHRDAREFTHTSLQAVDSTSRNFITIQKHIELNPSDYHIAIEFKDDSSGNISTVREVLHVEKYGFETLQLSDILLVHDIEPTVSPEALTIDNLKFTPNVSRIYEKPNSIFLYFEVYNLQLTGVPGNSRYKIEYSVQYRKSEDEGKWSLSAILGKVFNFSKNEYDLATEAEYSGISPVENLYIEINPETLAPGVYQLTLKVTDSLAGSEARKEALFYLAE